MPGILSLPSELLHEIIEMCSESARCRLRAACKVLIEHADPIVFRQLSLGQKQGSPHIAEHQIIALATRSSKLCEFTRDLKISNSNGLRASEQSWPHFGKCDDLKAHLPTGISTLRNLECFRWVISDDPDWLINSLMQAVARLPHLTELCIWTYGDARRARIPLGLFANLSRLAVWYQDKSVSSFISEMSTAIANSPQLRSLDVCRMGNSLPGTAPPAMSALFAKIPTENTLCLNYLAIKDMDATVDQVTLPHLKHLTSFVFEVREVNLSIPRSVWTSFLVNNIKLLDVELRGVITEETMLYLSSFSGLKSLTLRRIIASRGTSIKNMLLLEVLPKHVASLQTLKIQSIITQLDHTDSKSILKCLKLRDLDVCFDRNTMSVQCLLDTVALLPELRALCIVVLNPVKGDTLEDFKPVEGLRYVEELGVDTKSYKLEKEGERPVRYREIK